jgi:hypothetical protein
MPDCLCTPYTERVQLLQALLTSSLHQSQLTRTGALTQCLHCLYKP